MFIILFYICFFLRFVNTKRTWVHLSKRDGEEEQEKQKKEGPQNYANVGPVKYARKSLRYAEKKRYLPRDFWDFHTGGRR